MRLSIPDSRADSLWDSAFAWIKDSGVLRSGCAGSNTFSPLATGTLDSSGIQYTLIANHQDEVLDEEDNVVTPSQLVDCLVNHELGKDYIEEGEVLLEKLSVTFPSLTK